MILSWPTSRGIREGERPPTRHRGFFRQRLKISGPVTTLRLSRQCRDNPAHRPGGLGQVFAFVLSRITAPVGRDYTVASASPPGVVAACCAFVMTVAIAKDFDVSSVSSSNRVFQTSLVGSIVLNLPSSLLVNCNQ